MSQTEFFKNLGMMGGLLLVTVYGPGFWALNRVVDLRHGAAAYTAPGSLQHISDDAIPGSH